MTKTIRLGVAGIAMFAALGMSTTARADTVEARADAEVLTALDLTLEEGTLDFGQLVVVAGGSLTLAPNGNMPCTDASVVVCSGSTDNPEFSMSGTASKAVTVTFDESSITLNNTSGAGTMTVNAFQVSGGNTVTLDSNGVGAFTVGGTLTFGDNQQAGTYEGTFDVTVEYS